MRVVLFVVALLVIIGGAIAALVWYARSTYYVGLQGDRVVIFQGRPGGLLFLKPTVAEKTSTTTAGVPAGSLQALRQGEQEPSRQAAELLVQRLVAEAAQERNPTPLSTSGPGPASTSTTGAPSSPGPTP